jgi:signal transduction histidine kinase
MKVPAQQQAEPDFAAVPDGAGPGTVTVADTGRAAELAELLAHQTACWDEERRLLARRLHDSLGSSMTALTMHLALLSQHLAEPQRERAAQMKTLLNNIIETNRTMQLTLWNDKLEFLGPKAAIAELVAEWGQEHGIRARASLPDDDPDYSRSEGVALRNVLAHARASEVDVILDDDGDQAMLTVRDNGVGPGDAGAGSLHCHGLRLLRERARQLGGTLTIAPGPENGTALTLVLPRQ